MNPLPTDYINEHSPYVVKVISNDEVQFMTDFSVEYRVSFMEDYSIWSEDAYQFLINNNTHKPSPNDSKLRDTIMTLIEAFFISNPHILLYICDTGDDKQAARNRLFVRWFNDSKHKGKFYLQDVTISDDGIDNYAALIVQRNNPEFESIIAQFNEFVELMKNKPE